MTAERVGKIVGKLGRAARIVVDESDPRTGAPAKYATIHDLRRTAAQRWIESDLPAELVRKLMRHADIKTTERYYTRVNVQRDAGKIREALGR